MEGHQNDRGALDLPVTFRAPDSGLCFGAEPPAPKHRSMREAIRPAKAGPSLYPVANHGRKGPPAVIWAVKTVDGVGARVLGVFRYAWYLLAFFYLSLKMLWVGRNLGHRDFLRQVLLQVYFTAVQAIGPVAVLALGVGVLAIVQGVHGVGALSGAEELGKMARSWSCGKLPRC